MLRRGTKYMSLIILKTDEKQKIVRKVISKLKVTKGLDATKYCGKIKLISDPLEHQKKLRDEWE